MLGQVHRSRDWTPLANPKISTSTKLQKKHKYLIGGYEVYNMDNIHNAYIAPYEASYTTFGYPLGRLRFE
jgi:hypothetical protein